MRKWRDSWKRGLVLILTVALVGNSARSAMLSASAEGGSTEEQQDALSGLQDPGTEEAKTEITEEAGAGQPGAAPETLEGAGAEQQEAAEEMPEGAQPETEPDTPDAEQGSDGKTEAPADTEMTGSPDSSMASSETEDTGDEVTEASEGEDGEAQPEAEPENEALRSVKELLDSLPSLDELKTQTREEQSESYSRIQGVYDAYEALTDEQKAQVGDAEGIFTPLFTYFNGLVMPLEEDGLPEEVTVDFAVPVPDVDLPDNGDLLEGYIERLLYEGMYEDISLYGNVGKEKLTGKNLDIYNALKAYIEAIASGERPSTNGLEISDLTFTWTAKELGVESITGFTDELKEKISSKFAEEVSTQSIMKYLLMDCPYELYWFDKETGTESGYSMSSDGSSVTVSKLSFSFAVASGYGSNYTVESAQMAAVRTAVAAAKKIVEDNKNKSDEEKLAAYKDEICKLVSYNDAAADKSQNTPYGNPWQLIWVFDGDSSTEVVCEGYSKAFQYLCDLSTFADPGTRCYTVSGTMSGGTGAGRHMWNIVTLGGNSYLVDVTNCDEGTIGAPDQLFLAVPESGDISAYTFRCNSGAISYTYDNDQIGLLGAEILTLSETPFVKKNTPGVSGTLTASVTYGDSVKNDQINTENVNVTYNGANVPGMFQWQNVTSYGDAGTKILDAVFVPADETAYARVSNLKVDVTVARKNVTPDVEVTPAAYEYTGSAIEPVTVTVRDGDAVIPANEYTYSCTGNVNAGTVTVTVKDQDGGNYVLIESTATFTINPKDLSGAAVKVADGDYTYNGAAHTPEVTVTAGGRTLVKDTDYTVFYQDNTDAGTAAVTVTGKGNYTGTQNASFRIARKQVTAVVQVSDKVYDGNTAAAVTASADGIGEITGLTGTFADQNAGTDKTVTISGDLSGADFAQNYEVLFPRTATASITARPVTVTADPVHKTYGDPDPVLTYRADGLIQGDALSGALARDEGEEVTAAGYQITRGTLNGGNNYTIRFVSGILTIDPAEYTVSASESQNILVDEGSFAEPSAKGVRDEAVEGTLTYTYDGTQGTYTQIKEVLAGLPLGTTGTITYSFTASDPNYVDTPQTGAIQFTIRDIVFQVKGEPATEQNAVTVTASPVYGDDWSEIVKIGAVEAVAGVQKDGTADHFTLDVSGIPDSGIQTFRVVYNGTLNGKTYTDAEVCSGTVNVGRRLLTVSAGSGKVSKTYDGTTAAGIWSGTLALAGILERDADKVTVSAAPEAYDSPDVGGQAQVQAVLTMEGERSAHYVLNSERAAVPCEILPLRLTPAAEVVGTYRYTGEAIIPTVTVTAEQEITSEDYVLKLSDNTNAGTAKVQISPKTGSNYTWEPVELTFTIEKADHEDVSADISMRYGGKGTFSLAPFLPEGHKIGEIQVTDPSHIFAEAPVLNDTEISYVLVSDRSRIGQQAVLVIPVTETRNYHAFTLRLNVTVSDKMVQSGFGFEAERLNRTYGEADFTLAAGNAAAGSKVTYTSSDPTVASVDEEGKIHILSAGTAVLTAEASETDDYIQATASCILTIAPKSLEWDVSELYAVDKEGAISDKKATLYGRLQVSGILDGDDVVFICTADQLAGTYRAVTAGEQSIDLAWADAPAELQGTKSGSYTLPQALPELKGRINAVSADLPTPPESSEAVQFRLEMESGISSVPEALKAMEHLNTPAKIEAEMRLNIQKASGYILEEHTAVYDVVLLVNLDGSGWQKALKENFPADGLTITLPYPEGTGQKTHDFAVSHLFTEDMNGHHAGEVEYPAVEKTDQGIRFKVYGLSPIAIGWTEAGRLNNIEGGVTDDGSGSGDSASGSSGSSSSGRGHSTGSGRTSSTERSSASAVQNAETADHNPIVFYMGVLLLAVIGMGYVFMDRRRRNG